MKTDYEYIVVGLGGLGLGTAYWLSRRAGKEVLGLEQFELGHGRGASQDHSRIIRLSYHTPTYVELAKQAYQAWFTVQDEAQEQIVIKTGGLDFAPRNASIPLSDYTESMDACGVPYEHLDADEIMKRWPQFKLTNDIHGVYQSESGIAAAARGNAAHLRLARARGATLLGNMPVTTLKRVRDEIEVTAGAQTFRCKKIILTVDAWLNTVLANFDLKLPLTITREQVTYFATPYLEDFSPERFPIWIWMDEPSYYGFPAFGEAGPKAGQDVGGDEVTADTRSFDVNLRALKRVEDFLRRYIPTALGPAIYTKTCLYTMTPDRDFIIDALPEQPNVLVGQGAAHAYKFASVFGKILSELAIDGKTRSDISPFKIDRPILKMTDPPKNFMV